MAELHSEATRVGARRRAAEVDGIDRNFVSPEAFERGLARGDYAYDSNDCWPPAFLAEHGRVEPTRRL